MKIQNINKDAILFALDYIDQNPELKNGRESTTYDLLFNGKKYPPILVLSEANKFLGGEHLTIEDFGNNINSAFELIKNNGFEIQKKYSYYKQLKKFIEQAHTNSLFTKEYLSIYNELSVKVSFGQGSPARVPWIAFLNNKDTVQLGIYPVYLYYKDKNLLILAFGVSETYKPTKDWNINNKINIEAFFKNNNLGKPDRYGSSYVFKIYDTKKELDPITVDNDLNEIIVIYKKNNTLEEATNIEVSTIEVIKTSIKNNFRYITFAEDSNKSGFILSESLCLRFIASLLSKPFVILTGLSGSGKTKLALSFASWLCEKNTQYVIVPVGADWTNREPLLGYVNGLTNDSYIIPENNILSLIIKAVHDPSKPYFIILDEMNLSHVERYFADFLSAMESKESIFLHSASEDLSGVPASIKLPDNLFIIGTVNIDETTYMFSPKVLDRANVIEFRIDENDLSSYLKSNSKNNIESLVSKGSHMANEFMSNMRSMNKFQSDDTVNSYLIAFFKELKTVGAEFGYRTANEISKFYALVKKLFPEIKNDTVMDYAIMQKLLPKLHGSRRKLEPTLKSLASLCLHTTDSVSEILNGKDMVNFEDSEIVKFPISLEKLIRMYKGLINNNFTSYAEA